MSLFSKISISAGLMVAVLFLIFGVVFTQRDAYVLELAKYNRGSGYKKYYYANKPIIEVEVTNGTSLYKITSSESEMIFKSNRALEYSIRKTKTRKKFMEEL